MPIVLVVACFTAVALMVAFQYHFPSHFDEQAHFSVIKHQFEHLNLFQDTRQYKLVEIDNFNVWSEVNNYINHPSLYYIISSFIFGATDSFLVLRLFNVALIVAATVLTIYAARHFLADAPSRIMFAVFLVSFPKSALIGGMINNDNFAMLAAALVFAGLSGGRYATVLIAVGLALAGWTKLTALIALSLVVGVKIILDGRATIFGKAGVAAGTGAAVGAAPFLVNLIRDGQLFFTNTVIYGRPPEVRLNATFLDYLEFFLTQIVVKWPAAEGGLPFAVALIILLFPLGLAIMGTVRVATVRNIGLAYLAGIAGTFALHIAFGWQSFQTIGDDTIAQTRYYNVLWPGIALAAAAAVTHLQTHRLMAPASMAAFLTPTILGGLVVAAI